MPTCTMAQFDLTASGDVAEDDKSETKQAFCLSHSSSVARSHGPSNWLCVPVIWIPPRRRRRRRSNYSWQTVGRYQLLSHRWASDRRAATFLIFLLEVVRASVCVPLCPACADCPKSAVCPWDWPRPVPECPGCDVGGHGRRNCPSSCVGPPWRPAALHPVKTGLSNFKKRPRNET